MNAWVPAILVFVAVASATVAVVLGVEGIRVWRRRRAVRERVGEMLESAVDDSRGQSGLFRESRADVPTVFDAIAARFPRFASIPTLLENADVSWSPQMFLLLVAGGGLAGFLMALAAGNFLLAIPLTAAGAWIPFLVLKIRRNRRLAKFEEAFPESIDMLGRAIRAGHPLSAGIQMVGQEMTGPVGMEFRSMFEEQRFGVPFTDVLMGLVDRVDLVDVRIFSTAVLVQREVGGNLAEILDNISTMIRARFKIRRQLRTYTAQGRMSGLVVGLMPFVVGLAFYAINPEYVRVLFEHHLGRLMLAFGITMQILGYLWIRKIVNIEI
jgi:tight adherence protein B